MNRPLLSCLLLTLLTTLGACNRQYAVTINQRAVYTPPTQAGVGGVQDPGLQACINLALRQQIPGAALTALSCPEADITSLEGLQVFTQLRFLDLAGNRIQDLTPLTALSQLGGLNLPNNRITDVAPLLSMPGLGAVILTGNSGIRCAQLDALRERLEDRLTGPDDCRP